MSDVDVDTFAYQEMGALLSNGQVIRNTWFRQDQPLLLKEFRRQHHNHDVFASVCRFERPSRDSRYICPFFVDIDVEDDLEAARTETLRACDLLLERLGICPEVVDLFFRGAKGFHLVVSSQVFGDRHCRGMMGIGKALAVRLAKEGPAHIDLGVYQPGRLFRLANTINSKTGLYKVALEYKELRDLGLDYVLDLSHGPRDEDTMAVPRECPEAVAWFENAVSWHAQRDRQGTERKSGQGSFKRGWRMAPCVRCLEEATLPDGLRHQAYFALTRFYAWIGMHPLEAEDRLMRIDQRHPIRDPGYIQRVVESGVKYAGFPGCDDQVLKQFCDKAGCFVARRAEEEAAGGAATE